MDLAISGGYTHIYICDNHAASLFLQTVFLIDFEDIIKYRMHIQYLFLISLTRRQTNVNKDFLISNFDFLELLF